MMLSERNQNPLLLVESITTNSDSVDPKKGGIDSNCSINVSSGFENQILSSGPHLAQERSSGQKERMYPPACDVPQPVNAVYADFLMRFEFLRRTAANI